MQAITTGGPRHFKSELRLTSPRRVGSRPPMSASLAHYLDHDSCHGVRLTCLECRGHRDLSLTAVILRLEALGVDGPKTGISDVAKFVREPCPRCGGKAFETAPAL